MHACIFRVLAGQKLVESDEVVYAEGQRQRFGDGVARRGQLQAVQQKPVDQLPCPHALIRKTHTLPP